MLQKVLLIISYSTASLLTACGIAILTGLLPFYIQSNFRILFGIVLVLYGIYRIATIYSKNNSHKNEENFIE